MQTRTLGACGLRVSRLGLGTMTWGRDTSVRDAGGLLGAFTDAGGTLIDTAAAYGHGEVEKMLGRLLRSRRDEVVVATKAGYVLQDGRRIVDTSRRALLDDLAGSLRRLGTDAVDLWQVHAWGDAPLDETLSALDHAVTSGMARYVGVSNFIAWQTAAAVTWQRAVPGRAPVASAQIEYSLLTRRAEVEILPAVRALGLGFLPSSPVGRGVLTGKYRRGLPPRSRGASDHFGWFVEPYLDARSAAVVDAVVTAAGGLDLTPAQVALLWVRDAPGVTAPLLGARTVEQLQPYLDVEDVTLPDVITRALDDVSGGPNTARPSGVDVA